MASPNNPLPKPQRALISSLLVAGTSYLIQKALKISFETSNLSLNSLSQIASLIVGLFGLESSQGPLNYSTEASKLTSLEAFGDYLMFMILSMILNILIISFTKMRGFNFKRLNQSQTIGWQSPIEESISNTSNELNSFKGRDQDSDQAYLYDLKKMRLIRLISSLIKSSLVYTLAFCFFEISALCILTVYGKNNTQLLDARKDLSHNEYNFFRSLEERGDDDEEIHPISIPINQGIVKKSEKLSLAVGRVLASFDVQPIIILFSADDQWAYVTTDNPSLVRIYDTSNFKAPVQVATVKMGRLKRLQTFLELSPDGKMLVVSNFEDVKLINVTNPRSPQMMGNYSQDEKIQGYVFVSMAISPDNNYLYMAEYGLKILDISDPAEIKEIYFSESRNSESVLPLMSLSASTDRKLIFLANGNGSLMVYDTSIPEDPKIISIMNFNRSSANSVFLSKDDRLVHVVGVWEKKIAINILDVSDPLNMVEVSDFEVVTNKTSPPIIQSLSPEETKLYIIQGQLLTIDLLSMSLESHSENLIKSSLFSIDFSSDGRYAGVAYLEQIVFIELFTDYPNKNIFSPSNSTIASFAMDRRFDSWAISQDGNILFLAFNNEKREKNCFEIWDITNKETPKRLSSLKPSDFGMVTSNPILSFKVSSDEKRVYLKWFFDNQFYSKLMIFDISGDLSKPVKLKEFRLPLSLDFEDFAFSSNEQILCTAPSSAEVLLYNLSALTESSTLEDYKALEINSDQVFGNFDLIFAKNNPVLFVIHSDISIYNVSDVENPVLLSLISTTEGGSLRILAAIVSKDDNYLIIEWFHNSRKLQVYDISDLKSPKLISELVLPKRNFDRDSEIFQEFYGPFVYIEKQKMGYASTNGGKLLRIDLSDLKNPVISGIVPVSSCKDCGCARFIISGDGETAFTTNQTGMLEGLNEETGDMEFYSGDDLSSQISVVNLRMNSTLFIPYEKFLLGERYSDNVFILQDTGKQGYQVTPRTLYKVIELYSYEVQIVSSQESPLIVSSSLPDWMKFNQDTLLLTADPKSKKDLGVYTICSTISNQVKQATLENIGPTDSPFKVQEVLTMLISLGYMDHQFYLKTEFGTREDFFLPEQYSPYKDQIYEILSKNYIETCTKIEVVPSVNIVVSPSQKIMIDSLSTKTTKVDISLVPDGENTRAQFLNKVYGPMIPEIRDQKSRIVLEGPLEDINLALLYVVINMDNRDSFYDGVITVSDGMNYPIVNQNIKNISECFLKNSPPILNPNVTRSFQEQVERVAVSTGQYFTIIWDEKTFIDQHAETLQYSVVLDNPEEKEKVMPDWLTFSNLGLRGTPPEKLTEREISLKFVAKNEFQEVTVPFKLKVGISPTFALALLIKYSPMILTALGCYIKANRIYNIVFKKRYKHAKEYEVQVDQEISCQTILPILFVEAEMNQSRIIMKHLLRDLKMGSKNKIELAHYFIDPKGNLEKNKIIEKVKKVAENLPSKEKKKLRCYLEGSQMKVNQIIINEIVMLYINSSEEKATKKIFEEIKDEWADIVEWNDEFLFQINQIKFSEMLEKKIFNNLLISTEEEEQRLGGDYREKVNQNLLKDAIISHAWTQQSINILSTMVNIEMHEKFEGNGVYSFFKQDLEGNHLNGKLAVDYGVHCKLEDDMLTFFGMPKSNFKGRTLVVQIQTIQWRILKEIWIHENFRGERKSLDMTIEESSRSETSLRGHGYEIY